MACLQLCLHTEASVWKCVEAQTILSKTESLQLLSTCFLTPNPALSLHLLVSILFLEVNEKNLGVLHRILRVDTLRALLSFEHGLSSPPCPTHVHSSPCDTQWSFRVLNGKIFYECESWLEGKGIGLYKHAVSTQLWTMSLDMCHFKELLWCP